MSSRTADYRQAQPFHNTICDSGRAKDGVVLDDAEGLAVTLPRLIAGGFSLF